MEPTKRNKTIKGLLFYVKPTRSNYTGFDDLQLQPRLAHQRCVVIKHTRHTESYHDMALMLRTVLTGIGHRWTPTTAFLGCMILQTFIKYQTIPAKQKQKQSERARERGGGGGRESKRERILDEVCVYSSSVYRKRRLFCFRFILMSQQKAYIPRSVADMR